MRIERFEQLECWQTARELTIMVYAVSSQRKFFHDFALRDQIRRAAISIMSNIAEGFESRTNNLFIEFLGRAKGLAAEVRSQSYIAKDVDHISKEQFERLFELSDKVIRQISNFLHYLRGFPSNNRVHDVLEHYPKSES